MSASLRTSLLVLAFLLSLAPSALAQTSASPGHAHPSAQEGGVATAPQENESAPQAHLDLPPGAPSKETVLFQEYLARSWELRGKILARESELEIVLASRPGDAAAVAALADRIATLRAALYQETVRFRAHFAEETNTPAARTRGMDGMPASPLFAASTDALADFLPAGPPAGPSSKHAKMEARMADMEKKIKAKVESGAEDKAAPKAEDKAEGAKDAQAHH